MNLLIPNTGTINQYVVKKNDTLYSIAKKYDTTINELVLLNNLKNNNLSIGQILNIPVNDTSYDFNNYVVKKNDTLYTIANKYNTTVDSLININNLKSNILYIGQILKVPSSSIDVPNNNLVYTVQKGDTLYSIANKFGMTVNNIKQLNNLFTNTINIGQELLINSEYVSDITIGSSCYGEGFPQGIEYITYTVKKGDNLYNIAKKYNVTVEQIVKLNNLNNNNLNIGDVLKIKERD